MEAAILSIRSGSWRSRSVVCTFVEHGILIPNREDSVKQTFFEKNASGFVVGKNYSKGVIISHLLTCQGKSCSCLSFATDYLFGDIDAEGEVIDPSFWSATCERLVNDEMSYPFVAVFLYKQQAVLVSHLCHDETFCQELDAGTYILRNGILSKTAEHDEAVDEILMNAIETEEEMSHMSVHLSEFLCRQSTKQWPRPEGLSATLWHYGDQPGRICLNSCFSKQPKEVLHGAKKPKGKVSAFNFFARLKRSEVLKQDNAHTLKNNDINAILGQMWNNMSEDERAPYKALADADVVRYQEEMDVFNAEQEANNLGRGDAKAMTAYNRFMHEETKFVHGMNLRDAQTRMGKHAGLRWKNIDRSEEHMYNSLNAVEEAKLKKMF